MKNSSSRLFLQLAAGVMGLFLAASADAQPIVPTAPPTGDASAAVGHALQADTSRAVAALQALSPRELSDIDRRFRDCMLDRFGPNSRAADPVAGDQPFSLRLLNRFRRYWHQALTKPASRQSAETEFRRALAKDLATTDGWPEIDAEIQRRLAAEGHYALLGQTGPLREFMLWRRQRKTVEPVELPDGRYEANVVYLEDFESLGWGDWATCGRRGAGGWATTDALFAVTPRYESLLGEEFRVTFLGHETQHFSDLSHWAKMEPWELEYRAKLTELAQVKTTRLKVLRKFLEDQSEDRAHPHGYANHKLFEDLRVRLGLTSSRDLLSVDTEVLNAAALDLHRRDTQSRQAKSP